MKETYCGFTPGFLLKKESNRAEKDKLKKKLMQKYPVTEPKDITHLFIGKFGNPYTAETTGVDLLGALLHEVMLNEQLVTNKEQQTERGSESSLKNNRL